MSNEQDTQEKQKRHTRKREKGIKCRVGRDHTFIHQNDQRDGNEEGCVKHNEQSDLKNAREADFLTDRRNECKKLGAESDCIFGVGGAVSYLFHGAGFLSMLVFLFCL